MTYRREKGLCYNCDEKWNSSHRCKGRVLFFIVASDDPPSPDSTTPDLTAPFPNDPSPTFDPTSLHPHISLHAMVGVPTTETFRLYGLVNHARVIILVDSGSTHNFIQPRVAKFLNLPLEDTTPLRVMVGNGSVLDCQQLSPATKLLIQDHTFTITLRVLPLSGADIVLGVEWLRTLGPIITDYSAFTMHFNHQGHSITLSVDVQSDTDLVSANQV